MRVRIVSYEDINAWILGKFARRLQEELIKLGVAADIGNQPDLTADINHHIIYLAYNIQRAAPVDTLMITHVDDIRKLNLLKEQMKVAKAGICMSGPMMIELVSSGLPADKMLYINPAHDNVMRSRKIVIGITSKVQPDGCKREELVEQLFDHISPDVFTLSIMGAGWDKIADRIRRKGFSVNYLDEFQYEKYVELVPSFDYYLYTGQDEGSMGFIDALAAGVKTVVTPQGYHLDAPGGITHAFNEADELVAIFRKIESEKLALSASVADWTWKDYAIKHMEVWEYLLNNQADRVKMLGKYTDGLNSLIGEKRILGEEEVKQLKSKMRAGVLRRTYFKIRNFEYLKNKLKRMISGDRKRN